MPQVARFYDDYKGAQQCWQCPQDGAEDSLQIEVGMARAPLDEQTTELDEFDVFQKQIKKSRPGKRRSRLQSHLFTVQIHLT